jgi:pimeloyl-ACP methyl ester carboxylesterase
MKVACPTLVVVGDRERIYHPMAAISRARRLIASVVTELVPSAGHLPGMQMPDVVGPEIRAFLDPLEPEDGPGVEAPTATVPALVGASR